MLASQQIIKPGSGAPSSNQLTVDEHSMHMQDNTSLHTFDVRAQRPQDIDKGELSFDNTHKY